MNKIIGQYKKEKQQEKREDIYATIAFVGLFATIILLGALIQLV